MTNQNTAAAIDEFNYQACMQTPSCNECENSQICEEHARQEGY